ncbi:hypothetical protein CPY51_16095 [Rhizobium tubonense]|uniref:Uncharacterized protein n=2 Tax=Rhizobium tubonense TaxID=484088 RepID=A0A2W4EFD1_9HYPH|nr:hypothetical protein CPY51_16095 [Rhizobium tubonense]
MGGIDSKPLSLRKYLLTERKLGEKIRAKIVLAEAANQLYRDTEYNDLISFEEDIAVIASVVLLIAESAGSLAELGAFATSDQIRPSTCVILKTEHYEAESFVRFGPVQKIFKEDERRIAAFPWRNNKHGEIIKSSIQGHFSAIKKFVNSQISQNPEQFLFRNSENFQIFGIILWIIHLSKAISVTEILGYVREIGVATSQRDVKINCIV